MEVVSSIFNKLLPICGVFKCHARISCGGKCLRENKVSEIVSVTREKSCWRTEKIYGTCISWEIK